MIRYAFAPEEPAMFEPAETAQGPGRLPTDRRTRRLAITALANRAIAQKRDAQISDVLGNHDAYLVTDMLGALTGEVAAQLMLTEHLLSQGWAWDEILRNVWYQEEPLRKVATSS
jgi:hypothetical protein